MTKYIIKYYENNQSKYAGELSSSIIINADTLDSADNRAKNIKEGIDLEYTVELLVEENNEKDN